MKILGLDGLTNYTSQLLSKITNMINDSVSKYLPLTGGTMVGDLILNTDSGDDPLIITRNGDAKEQTSIYQTDNGLVIDTTNDETINTITINMTSTDTENSDGSGANSNTVKIASSSSGSAISANTFVGRLAGNANTATNLNTARTLTIGNTGKTFDGSSDVSWSLNEIGAIPLSGSTEITGTLRTTGEYQVAGANGLRIAYGNYGTIFRNDGSKTYILLTNENDKYGSWNTLRPFSIDNSTGVVSCENGLKGTLDGTANKSNAIASTGFGDTSLTYYQTDGEFDGHSGWTHYIIANHGNGESYYHYTIGLPFGGIPIYQRQSGSTDNKSGWHNFYTDENITYGTDELTAGSSSLATGSIYLQYE